MTEFAVGRASSAGWTTDPDGKVRSTWTDPLPAAEVERVAPNEKIDGVEWDRERHSYSGATHGFTIEVTTGVHAGWTLRVVKEYWRDSRGESTRDLQWAHVEAGGRAEIVAWLKRQERAFE